MIKTEISGDELRVSFGRDESQAVARAWRDGLVALWERVIGASPGAAQRTTCQSASDYDPAWREVWSASDGRSLVFEGEGVMSPHGCHGETLEARALELPPGVTFEARWDIDHRRGGMVKLRLRGLPDSTSLLTELADTLRACG